MKFDHNIFKTGSLLAGACLFGFALNACSQTESNTVNTEGFSSVEDVTPVEDVAAGENVFGGNVSNEVIAGEVAVSGSDEVGLWRSWNTKGVADYFDSLANKTPFNTNFIDDLGCKFPALMVDEATENLDELENLFKEGHLVKGVCGLALNLKDGQVAPLGVNLVHDMPKGSVEFWFRPGDDFYNKKARTLLGNDESRLHFFVKDGELIFQKNHADKHFFVKAPVNFGSGWTKIGGQWGDGYMSLWVNDTLVARMEHSLGYQASRRGKKFGNLLVIGYKSYCCMEPTGQYSEMTTSGSFDQFRISSRLRYDNSAVKDFENSAPADENHGMTSNYGSDEVEYDYEDDDDYGYSEPVDVIM